MLLTKSEAAEFLSVSLSYFKAKIQPLLPCVRTGRLVRFDRRDLERWAEERKVGPSDVQTQTVLSTFGSRIKEKVTNSRREQEILMKLRPRPRNATRRSSLAVEHLEPLPRASNS
jgi:excisionase family DNA binding protein